MPPPAEATLLVTYNTEADVHVIDVVERTGGPEEAGLWR
jgi:hypothetical protein